MEPFVKLLNGAKEEIILRERAQLTLIATAVNEAKSLGAGGEDLIDQATHPSMCGRVHHDDQWRHRIVRLHHFEIDSTRRSISE